MLASGMPIRHLWTPRVDGPGWALLRLAQERTQVGNRDIFSPRDSRKKLISRDDVEKVIRTLTPA